MTRANTDSSPTPLERFKKLDGEAKVEFRAALTSYTHLYAFLSQVLAWTDAACQRLHIYGRALAQLLLQLPDEACIAPSSGVKIREHLVVASRMSIGDSRASGAQVL